MRKHGWIVFLLAVVVVLMLFYTVAFTVSYRQTAVVKTFGKVEEVIYGQKDAGLHWKWPWPIQRLIRYDSRMFIFEDTFKETVTNDQQNILVSVFCGWRIRDADTFIRAISGQAKVKDCEERLRTSLRDAKGDVVATHPLADFVNTDPDKMRMTEIENEILAKIKDSSLREYGVEIVTVGIKSLGLPPKVTEKVIENMQAERTKEANTYRSSGNAVANTIRERAITAREQILAFADNKAELIRAKGDREAAKHYKTFKDNEEFAIFLRELKFLTETLPQNSVVVLDSTMLRCIGYFKDGAPDLPVKKQAEDASNKTKKTW
ncbi:MAG: protease modulator HflC [Phycisphaerae bacterium]|nr:protease modulator HflC [Phycisphaerae bacterium]